MRIKKVIAQLRELKPNQYTDGMLLNWLSELDGQIYEDVLKNTEDAPSPPCLPYTVERDMDRQLLVKGPHHGLYIHYLSAQIDYYNGEYERYNNGMVMYNVAYQAFADAWTREHMHRQDGVMYV